MDRIQKTKKTIEVRIKSLTPEVSLIRMERQSQEFLEMKTDAIYLSSSTARQTFSRKGFLRLNPSLLAEEFSGKWFFKVILMPGNDTQFCSFNLNKTLTVEITSINYITEYYGVIVGTCAFFAIFFLAAFFLSTETPEINRIVDEDNDNGIGSERRAKDRKRKGKQTNNKTSYCEAYAITNYTTEATSHCLSKTLGYLLEIHDKIHNTWQSLLKGLVLDHNMDMFLLVMIALIGIAYGIPALQIVWNAIWNFHSGDTDTCHFNFQCATQVGFIVAFNNVISNSSYLLLGIAFLFLTGRKARGYRALVPKRHFLLYYAYGLALIFESAMSSLYHICPTNSNLQFDTTFMFVICVLIFLILSQKRKEGK